MIMDEVLDLHVLNLLKREVIVVLWSTIVYNIFIDTDVAPTEVTNTTDKVVELYPLNLLIREVIVVLSSTIVYKIFIDTDDVPTGAIG